MRIVLDLDGVICKFKEDPSDDYYQLEPFPEAVETLQKLNSEGHYIIIHTARGMTTENGNIDAIYKRHYTSIYNWLTKWNIPFDKLILGKPLADFYVDDRAIFHKDWRNTNTIINYEKWIKPEVFNYECEK
jgi:capsule biosynthesis phosphatase